MAYFEKQAEMLVRPQLDIAQIALVCVLGYADFRFADCGWRKAFPNLDAFHQKMLERPSVKISVPTMLLCFVEIVTEPEFAPFGVITHR